MDKEQIKKKNNLMSSIMRDAKLSRAYRDALNSPPGSTKRDQAKSTFSIMRKVSGLDGQGGPFSFTNPVGSTPPASVAPAGQNFGNMLIFPAIPKMKTPAPYVPTAPAPIPYGSVGLTDGKNTTTPYTMPAAPAGTSYSGYGPALTDGKTFVGAPSSAFGLSSTTTPATTLTVPKNLFASSTPAKKQVAPPANNAFTGITPPAGLPGLGYKAGAAVKKSGLLGDIGNLMNVGMYGTLGGLQWAGQNIAHGIGRAGEWLTGVQPNSFATPSTSFGATPGGKVASYAAGKLIGPEAAYTQYPALGPAVQAATQPPTGDLPVYGPERVEETKATLPGGGAPSFYSTLGKQVSTPLPGNVTTGLPVAERGVTDKFKSGIIATEGTGDYTQIGKITSSGYPALGKYQIMPNLWFPTIGLDSSNEDDVNRFLNTPELQDQLFGKILDTLDTKYAGDQAKMAAAYFGGDAGARAVGTPEGDKISDGNMTVNQYAASVLGSSVPIVGGAYNSKAPDVSAAIAASVGSGQYALDATRAQMGGTPVELRLKAEETLRKNYRMDELEEEVSQALIDGPNFRPTLQKYMNGRDEILKDIDARISEEEDRRAHLDMGNPSVAQSYNNHLAYLYTLKGAQEQRYGNYLDNAVAQFESDYQRKRTALESAQGKIERALAAGDAITLEQYNNIATSAAGAYTELQNAPIVKLNYDMAKQQYDENVRTILKNIDAASGLYDPDYRKNYDAMFKAVTDKDGNISPQVLGAGGILGQLQKSQTAGEGINAAISAVNTAIANAIRPDEDGNAASVDKIMETKKIADDFNQAVTGTDNFELGASVMENFATAAEAPLMAYILNNIEDIQNAVKDISDGKMSIAQLQEKYSSINTSVMRDLYDTIKNNPATVSSFLTGSSQQSAEMIAGAMAAMW